MIVNILKDKNKKNIDIVELVDMGILQRAICECTRHTAITPQYLIMNTNTKDMIAAYYGDYTYFLEDLDENEKAGIPGIYTGIPMAYCNFLEDGEIDIIVKEI